MRKPTKKIKLFLLPVFLFFLITAASLQSSAASNPAKITSCRLTASNKVKVTVKISDPKAISGKKVYLFALSLSDSKIKASAKPLRSKTKAKSMTFSVSLKNAKTSSRLYSRFVIASKTSGGSYKIISNAKYITNAKMLAEYKYAFPASSSKKGLQVSPEMLEDAIELNIRHSVLNIVFSDLISTPAEKNSSSSISYKYHGTTYWFRRSIVNSYDAQLKALQENNVTVSAILLLGWRDDLTNLIYPSGRERGHSYYAWNTKNADAREQLQATISFLASRYCTAAAANGRIVNWIVGNEVNNYYTYNYAGKKTLNQYAKIYANAFRMTYNTVTSIYSNARVYISLDHLWNTSTVSGTFAARKMLDKFASILKNQGNISWNLAYHPYSSPLTEPKFWTNTNAQLTASLTSPVINMGNINLLTSYIRNTYDSDTRIILSELGYTSSQYGANTETAQSAAIAYSYYLTEADSMIDSIILNRQVDHKVEVAQGLSLGLWTTSSSSLSPESADEQKDSWTVFKYMDSDQAESVTSDALSVIGVNSWTDVVSGYSKSLYSKNSIAVSDLKQVSSYTKTASLASGWKLYGAALSKRSAGDGSLLILHDSSSNRNRLWGVAQSLSKKVSFARHPVFYTTLKVTGSTNGTATVKIRFYSTNTRMLECSRIIPTNRDVKLGVSLADWKYKKAVRKIQILIAPAGGSWSGNAALEMTLPVRGK